MPIKIGSTQILLMQEIIDSLAPNGRAGIVVDEGLLFRTNENAFKQTKRKLLPSRADSENSWTVPRQELEARNYDLKAVNPNKQPKIDTRTPDQLLNIIQTKAEEIQRALDTLRAM